MSVALGILALGLVGMHVAAGDAFFAGAWGLVAGLWLGDAYNNWLGRRTNDR